MRPVLRGLMADGSTKNIEHVRADDMVVATNPLTRRTAPHKVTRLIITDGDKYFDELTIATRDGWQKLTATYEHPFWNPAESRWVKARDLRPGSTLLSRDGSTVHVQANRPFGQRVRTYNLTVEDFHMYYVLAGKTPILVHNSGCGETTFYHASDANSLVDVLNNGLDESKAARKPRGGIIKVRITDDAMSQLREAGAVTRPIPESPKSPNFVGEEFHIPKSSFDLFNRLMKSGGISVSP